MEILKRIDNKSYKAFIEFCKFNGFSDEDIEKEFVKIFNIGFNVYRFGVSPFQKELPIVEEKPKKTTRKSKTVAPTIKEEPKNEQKTEEPQTTKKKVRIIKK